ncbi:oxidoreductase [Aquimarina sp. 2201CG5-10]|uniref:WD40/YVTN/BNR-like repeat-containing protein n=1 Tax=Aquimarina callyspongiae TaxID=3098150 RepID=UPI002AB54B60|nr:oxidoreductase [Aquimarina sp. 2201CG5-10]MDY8137246.1 oxidoreductase [Aquimarina sp. 2201CG5-10]
MRIITIVALIMFFVSCKKEVTKEHNFTQATIETVYQDSISIRAITMDKNLLMYAGNNGKYGYFKLNKRYVENNALYQFFKKKNTGVFNFEGKKPSFRAIADTRAYFFVLSIESPALLYKVSKRSGKVKLVYTERHEKIFYNSMMFWNEKEGIAMGDPVSDCLSILITRDGGESWNKLSCNELPKTIEGEAAFAASDSNISIVGDKTWIISGGMKSRVFYSPDKGKNWEVYELPIVQGTSTTGAYTIHFYDESNGVVFGGDYTKPEKNIANKAITKDGGKTWQLIATGKEPGYKSSVRYIPNSGGKEMVAIGFTGLSISNDYGENWKELSKEAFLTLRFVNDSTAIAAGRDRIARIVFR